ncbi:MAG: biopolymer transporter ExbD [Deltaproteobacteria bacterium]|nr:biopolymer transporter ExbD [Candidatus Zymogenaceae bacterium]
MNFAKRAKSGGEVFINLTSLIDVVLNLIIFFVLSTTFINPTGLKIELPRSAVEETVGPGEEVVVVVTRENEILMDGEAFSPEALLDKLSDIRETNPEGTIVIQADEKSAHGAVVSVMDAAKRAGFEKLSIATKKER